MSNRLFLLVLFGWAATTLAVAFACKEKGYELGAHDTANQFFQWCHDEGGILSNPETGQKIGCGQVVKSPGA